MHRLPHRIFALCFATALLLPACRNKQNRADASDDFMRLSNVGKAHLQRGEAQPALAAFEKALALNSTHPDAN
jgi:tetratricopeptide (TPR) repeat protein